MDDSVEKLGPLCSSCGSITLAALVEAVPIPEDPRFGCGQPSYFEFSIPQPLTFPNLESAGASCALCSLVASLESQSETSHSGALKVAALCPPSWFAYQGLNFSISNESIGNYVARIGEPQPQWLGFEEGEKRVNTLEPVTQQAGSRTRTVGYEIHSPWQINVAAEEGSAAGVYITRRPLLKQDSEAYYQGILRIVENCNANHSNCRLGVDGWPLDDVPSLPTRVIHVGSAEERPRLVISNARKAHYATLSHCWGSQRWVATTTQSLSDMLGGFDLADIPKTYADAIAMTRELGIQFLWIDSFCIIQDDRQDWAAESRQMGDIYENAYINIAAAGAVDGNTGFLGTRKEHPIYVRVPAADDSGSGSADPFYFTNQPNSDFNNQVARVKLNTRGWVLQERLLSRRTLHFATDMWYFECGQHILSEDGWQHSLPPPPPTNSHTHSHSYTPSLRQTLPTSTSIGKVFRTHWGRQPIEPTTTTTTAPTLPPLDNTDRDHDTNPNPNPGQDIRDAETDALWAQILRAYSRTDLTFPSDKQPALTGLVHRFGRVVAAAPHVCGHWLRVGEPLPLSMMWSAARDGGLEFPGSGSGSGSGGTGTEMRRGGGGKRLLAPSWSCLKGMGPVEFCDTRGAGPCTRGDFVVVAVAAGDDPDGEERLVPSIEVRGRLRGATLGQPNGEGAEARPTFWSLSFQSKSEYGVFTRSVGPARFDDADDVPKEVTLLLTYEVLNSRNSTTGDQLALVLREVGSKGDVPRYERIGTANVHNHSFFDGVPFSSLVII